MQRYGAVGMLFLVPWLSLAKDSPNSSEGGVIQMKSEQKSSDDETSIFSSTKATIASAPWKGFVQSKGVWAMFLAHAANNWGL